MRNFEDYINEANGGGDCLLVAGRGTAFFDMDRDPITIKLKKDGAQRNKIRCVHAMVTGQGQLDGVRFVHAWIEYNNKVYDFSNGREYVLNKDAYYAVGKIDPSNSAEYRSYTADQVQKKIISTGHWGPWDF